jgi:hypothetical protein
MLRVRAYIFLVRFAMHVKSLGSNFMFTANSIFYVTLHGDEQINQDQGSVLY